MSFGLSPCDPRGTARIAQQESIPIPIAIPTPQGEACASMKRGFLCKAASASALASAFCLFSAERLRLGLRLRLGRARCVVRSQSQAILRASTPPV